MEKYAFSQSLDNTSPDIMIVGEEIIGPNSQERKKIANLIFEVSQKGKIILEKQFVFKIQRLNKSNTIFYIVDLATDQLDVAGRKTSVTFLFNFRDDELKNNNIKNFKNSLEDYMKKVLVLCEKTTQESNINVVANKIVEDLQKLYDLKQNKFFLIILFVLVAVLFFYLLKKR